MSNNNSLHPEILFHFTNKKALYGILNETFKIFYSLEKIKGITNSPEFGVPMVSFCDLKLSELKTHMKNYGSYGIGLTKEWAFRSNLNPVFYVNGQSAVINNYLSSITMLFSETQKASDEQFIPLIESYDSFLKMYRFMKNYQGELRRKKKKKIINNFRFADEREWRYVPYENLDFPFAPKDYLSDDNKKIKLNSTVSNLRLQFQAEDIKYIIIKRDNEISGLIKHLEKVKGIRYDENTIQRLKSRILTAEQIYNDV